MLGIILDQLGREIQVHKKPERIVSLVPSLTEFLFDLGLVNEIVGVTKFCVHPSGKVNSKEKIGGTKDFDVDKIKALNPDLIIASKEENHKVGIDELANNFPVYVSDISNLNDAFEMMSVIGKITGREQKAEDIINEIQKGFKRLIPVGKRISTLYFIWRNPYMTVGGDTFIHSIMNLCGFDNLIKEKSRYPSLSAEEIQRLNPELILLSSEPYPFKERHLEEFKELCPDAKIILVDGEMFSWYGSRLLKSADYLNELNRKI